MIFVNSAFRGGFPRISRISVKISKKLMSGEAAAPRRARPRNHQYSYRNIDGFEGWAGLRVGKLGCAKKKLERRKNGKRKKSQKLEN